MKRFLFIKEDLDILRSRLENLRNKFDEAAKNTGKSCQESSETFHDNFPYEQAMRDMEMYGRMMAEIGNIISKAEIVPPPRKEIETVEIGTIVKVLDLNSDHYEWIRIGGYMVLIEDEEKDGLSLENKKTISYNSPLGQCLMGGKVHNLRKFTVGNEEKRLIIYEVIN